MLTHEEDIHKIPDIWQTIKQTLTTHSTHFPIFIEDFNRHIFTIGCHSQFSFTQPTNKDKEWQIFTSNLQLTRISNTSIFSRQGEPNYNHTSLIDGFYNSNTHSIYQICCTNMQLYLNSHHLPPQFVVRKPPTSPTNTHPNSYTLYQKLISKISLLNSMNKILSTSNNSPNWYK